MRILFVWFWASEIENCYAENAKEAEWHERIDITQTINVRIITLSNACRISLQVKCPTI